MPANERKPQSSETKARISASMRGRHLSESHKNNIARGRANTRNGGDQVMLSSGAQLRAPSDVRPVFVVLRVPVVDRPGGQRVSTVISGQEVALPAKQPGDAHIAMTIEHHGRQHAVNFSLPLDEDYAREIDVLLADSAILARKEATVTGSVLMSDGRVIQLGGKP